MTEMQFQNQAKDFLSRLAGALERHRIFLEPSWDIDHICYRTQSLEAYEQHKSTFLNFSQFLGEAVVSGRPISTFELKNPIWFQNRRIDLVELPAPKEGRPTQEGFEHIEVVVNDTFQNLIEKFKHHQLELKGLQKKFNQELEIVLPEGSLKFHQLSLKSVIQLESNQKVWQALEASRVLEVFKPNEPLVAGTFPLGVFNKASDLDILLFSRNLNETQDQIANQKNWGPIEISRKRINQLETIVARFRFMDVPFEIFAQARHTVLQQAYRHFLIEEKALKYKGTLFFERIVDLRRQGLKTEPAFALALGLEGDPYKELLSYEKMTGADWVR